MTGFFGAWIGLTLIATVVSFGVSLAVFRFIDVTFTHVTILLVAPAAQAAVLTWPAGLGPRMRTAARLAWRHRLTVPVLLIDGVLVVAGLIWWSSSALGFGAPVTIQPTWIAVKALAAAGLCVAGARGVSLGGRVLMGLVLALVAAHAQFNVLEHVFAVIDRRAAVVAEVFLRLAWYGSLYIAAMWAVIRVSGDASESARVWMTTAAALSVPGVLLVLLSMFNNPGVLSPWRGLALMWATAAVTALTLGVLTTSTNDGDPS